MACWRVGKSLKCITCVDAGIMTGSSAKRLRQILTLLLGLAIIAGLIHYLIGEQAFFKSLASLDISLLVIAVLIYSASWLVRAIRLVFLIYKMDASMGFFTAFRFHIAQFAMNVILPLKAGDFAAALALRGKYGLSRGAATIIQIRVLDLVGLSIFAIMSLLFMDLSALIFIPLLLVLCLLVGGMAAIMVFNRSPVLNRIFQKLGGSILTRITDRPDDALKNFTTNYELLLRPQAMVPGILLSLAIWFFEAMTFYFIALSLGFTFAIPMAIAAVVIGNLAKAVPATPASIGIYESAVAGVLIFLGVTDSSATTAAILDHLVKNIFLLALGLPNLPMLSSRMLSREKTKKPPEEKGMP